MALVRGTIVSFDSGAHAADVRLDGSQPQRLEGLATSHGIDAAEMTPGRRVLIDTGESGETGDVVIYAVFG
jgi:hypothetical protein